MAAIIQCESCGKVCPHNKAVHVRVHALTSATEYKVRTDEYYDICAECHRKFKSAFKQGAKE